MKINKDITKKELKAMGFSRLAVEFIFPRRGMDMEKIKEEIFMNGRQMVPFGVLQNIAFIMACHQGEEDA